MPSSSTLVAVFLNLLTFQLSSACYPTNNVTNHSLKFSSTFHINNQFSFIFKYYFPENKPAHAIAIIKGIYENHNISGIVRFKQEVSLKLISIVICLINDNFLIIFEIDRIKSFRSISKHFWLTIISLSFKTWTSRTQKFNLCYKRR